MHSDLCSFDALFSTLSHDNLCNECHFKHLHRFPNHKFTTLCFNDQTQMRFKLYDHTLIGRVLICITINVQHLRSGNIYFMPNILTIIAVNNI